MNKSELIESLSEKLGGKPAAAQAVEHFVDTVTRAVASGEKVAITGFGVFEKADRAARTGRNPATGAPVKIKKTSVPKFRPGAEFKAVVSGAKKLAKATKSTATKTVATRRPSSATKATAAKTLARPSSAPATRTAAAKTLARKAPAASKAPAKKTATRSTAATTAKRTTAAKAPAKKTTAAKKATAAKKTTAAKAPAKRTAAKKAR